MGRSLFSQRYTPAPAVRTEPERVPDLCEKWSIWNKFDPDSDEFFENAVDEVFTDLDTVRQQQADELAEEVRRAVVDVNTFSSDSSDSGASDTGSPMATGSDDPAVLLAESIPLASDEWQQHFLESGAAERGQWQPLTRRPQPRASNIGHNPDNTSGRPDLDHIISATRTNRYNRARTTWTTPAVFPPSNVRSSIIANDVPTDQIPTPPRSPVLSRPVVVLPPSPRSRSLSPPRSRPRSPVPTPALLPATPSTPLTRAEDTSLVSPSPPGTVTPARPYNWRDSAHWHPIPAIPASPTRARANRDRDGPLTNPRARMSYARLTTVQASALVQNVN